MYIRDEICYEAKHRRGALLVEDFRELGESLV